jgi:hypothetical protein
MEDRGAGADRSAFRPSPWMVGTLILGAYWTAKGYHILDGDQAHRLPLLLHGLDPRAFDADPFVRSFDAFNPHRGSLWLVGAVARVVGLSAALTILFVLTFAASVSGVARLGRTIWPGTGNRAGLAAVGLFLIAKAGNIGTNHLFESMLLDRLMALSLAWLAAAAVVEDPRRGWRFSAIALGGAAAIHPSIGLQLSLVFAGAWLAWALAGSVGWRVAIPAATAALLAVAPGLALNLAPFGSLRDGLAPETFWLLTVELQSPQHMLPHLWRMPQWLAAGAYLMLALISLRVASSSLEGEGGRRPDAGGSSPPAGRLRSQGRREEGTEPAARLRLVLMLGVVLFWLACSWAAVEIVRHVGATVFQPFRMATFARGLALVCAAGYVVALWDRGGCMPRLRAALIPLGLTGDWLLVVVVGVETATLAAEGIGRRVRIESLGTVAFTGALAYGGLFLSRHDTEHGGRSLLALIVASLVAAWVVRRASGRTFTWTRRRWRWAMGLAWATPVAALVAGLAPLESSITASPIVRGLVARCRFSAAPVDDVEILASWCRANTPTTARFIGPPGPKGFRLWSRRSLAFNRAGSPYHAEGIHDWYLRFADHVDFRGTPGEFVRAYLDGRHRLEARYDAMSDAQLAALAARQGADHVVALRREALDEGPDGPLEFLHAEGKYAVYRVRDGSPSAVVAQRQR